MTTEEDNGSRGERRPLLRRQLKLGQDRDEFVTGFSSCDGFSTTNSLPSGCAPLPARGPMHQPLQSTTERRHKQQFEQQMQNGYPKAQDSRTKIAESCSPKTYGVRCVDRPLQASPDQISATSSGDHSSKCHDVQKSRCTPTALGLPKVMVTGVWTSSDEDGSGTSIYWSTTDNDE
eukprot:SAG31_NODE_4996_length_2814_cov_1.124125_2_plen_176_part_00